jgi:hypothetical protein
MFYLCVVFVGRSSICVFLWGSSLSCIDVVCLMSCVYVTTGNYVCESDLSNHHIEDTNNK